ALLTVTFSYALTLRIRSVTTLSPLLGLGTQPVMLLSGMLLPLTLAPLWMVDLAHGNPFYWATNGMRELFAGHLAATAVWVSVLVFTALSALTLPWSVRLFALAAR